MRASEFANQLNEKINEKVVEPGFTAEKWINGQYLLRAVARETNDPNDNLRGLIITAHDPKSNSSFSDTWGIGMVRFVARQDKQTGDWYLVSSSTSVNNKYQRQGIASAMYQWARELGNDIEPSSNRTAQGQHFWNRGAGVGRQFTDQQPEPAKSEPAKPLSLKDRLLKTFVKNNVAENFADGKVKGKSRPGRVKRAGASCKGSVSDLRSKAKKYGGEKGKMYHWCANMKSGKKK